MAQEYQQEKVVEIPAQPDPVTVQIQQRQLIDLKLFQWSQNKPIRKTNSSIKKGRPDLAPLLEL
jgi:hypothetical protein